MNLFPSIPLPPSPINKKKTSSSSSSSQDARIAQLAKQMAYERMLQEIDSQRHPTTNKKSKIPFTPPSSILTESIHVNHLLNDVMMRILHEMYEKQQVPQPRASRKGELLFVKKQNINNDEQYNFINHPKKQHKVCIFLAEFPLEEVLSFSITQNLQVHHRLQASPRLARHPFIAKRKRNP